MYTTAEKTSKLRAAVIVVFTGITKISSITFLSSRCWDEDDELFDTGGYRDFVCLPDSSSDNAIAAAVIYHVNTSAQSVCHIARWNEVFIAYYYYSDYLLFFIFYRVQDTTTAQQISKKTTSHRMLGFSLLNVKTFNCTMHKLHKDIWSKKKTKTVWSSNCN